MQGKTKVHSFFANENRKSRQTKPKSEFALTWSEREKGDPNKEDRRRLWRDQRDWRSMMNDSEKNEDERTKQERKEKNEKRRTY